MSKLTGTFSDTDREVHFLKVPVGIDRECYLMFAIGKGGVRHQTIPGSACEMRLAQKQMILGTCPVTRIIRQVEVNP
jgi:hypothetical protein